MSIAGDKGRNLEAVAFLALLLSFSSFSFITIVSKQVACFPGDIGTLKCPVSNPSSVSNRYSQSGTTTCTIIAGIYKNLCSVTFPAAFSTTPAINATIVEFNTNTLTWGGGQNIPLATIPFFTATPVAADGIWANMPVANTEFFGLTNNRVTAFISGTATVLLSIDVTAASNSATATLELDQNANAACTGAWTSLVSLSVFTAGQVAGSAVITPTSSSLCYRISGTNGGGMGDNPQFGNIAAQFLSQTQGYTIDKTGVSTTTLSYFVATTPVLPANKNLVLTWNVWVCLNGVSNC